MTFQVFQIHCFSFSVYTLYPQRKQGPLSTVLTENEQCTPPARASLTLGGLVWYAHRRLSPMGTLMGAGWCLSTKLTANHAASRSHSLADTSNCLLVGVSAWGTAEGTQLGLLSETRRLWGDTWALLVGSWGRRCPAHFYDSLLILGKYSACPGAAFLHYGRGEWSWGCHVQVNLTSMLKK